MNPVRLLGLSRKRLVFWIGLLGLSAVGALFGGPFDLPLPLLGLFVLAGLVWGWATGYFKDP